MKRVLIVCTGNCCRSPMAEALWRELGAGEWEACSAGVDPAGFVHPLTLAVLAERGIDTERLRSKGIDEVGGGTFDLVLTVCGHAQASLPALPGGGRRLHWPFSDPYHATGSDDERIEAFRQVRDAMTDRIRQWLTSEGGAR